MKACRVCHVVKQLSEFYSRKESPDKRRTDCKVCNNAKKRKWELSHPDQNRATKLAGQRRRFAADPEKVRCYHRSRQSLVQHKKTAYMRERRRSDENFRLASVLRAKLSSNLVGRVNSRGMFELLGCSMDYFRKYIERKFQAGMSWARYGNRLGCWSLDHRQPLSRFDLTDKEQLLWAFHYSNIQPMWAKENAMKSNKIAA